jgi:hypothetical protein
MEDFGFTIAIISLLLYIPLGLFMHIKYLSDKRRFSRLERNTFLLIEILFIPAFILLIIGKFTGIIPSWEIFVLGVFGLVILNLVSIFAQHLSEAYQGWRIEQRRGKILNLPEGPKKWKMEKEQEYMENLWKHR